MQIQFNKEKNRKLTVSPGKYLMIFKANFFKYNAVSCNLLLFHPILISIEFVNCSIS
jgi:hypothetical protein